jgi:hypothetical protein
MKFQKIVLNLNGRSKVDMLMALEAAMKSIKDDENLSGQAQNSTGGYSFEVENNITPINPTEISKEALNIAAQLEKISSSMDEFNKENIEETLIDFAMSGEGLNMDNMNEHIQGNTASMIQVMMDEFGGVDNEADRDVAEGLNHCFDFDSPILVLSDEVVEA